VGEGIPASSAQPLRRDEIAYQRQMALQSVTSQPIPRSFAPPRQPVTPAPVQPPLAPVALLESLSLTDDQQSIPVTPQEQARRIQHTAVITRASTMLRHDQSKMTEFRNRVSSYKSSDISASELIDSFFALFDCSSSELGKLVKELADIYENQAKRDNLLKAWNDWRAINEDYPSLPGPAGDLPTAPSNTSNAGRRILKLKSSTAQSSRSAANQQVAWAGTGRSSATPGASPALFPSLAASSNRGGTSRSGAVPWASTSASKPSVPQPRAAQGPTPRVPDAFPALPQAAKPNTHQMGLHHGRVRWDDGTSIPTNAWSGNNSTSTGASANPSAVVSENEEGDGNGLKGKKGKKGKQTLLKYG
jgi:E3 ubiquitin-protein ligase ZNF598